MQIKARRIADLGERVRRSVVRLNALLEAELEAITTENHLHAMVIWRSAAGLSWADEAATIKAMGTKVKDDQKAWGLTHADMEKCWERLAGAVLETAELQERRAVAVATDALRTEKRLVAIRHGK